MSIVYRNSNGKTKKVESVVFNGVPINRLEYDSGNGVKQSVWCRPYTLTIQKGVGVISVEVKRTASQEPSATIGVLTGGSTIYHGDTLTVSVSTEEGYEADNYTTKYSVKGNVDVNITASKRSTASVEPVITTTWETLNSAAGRYQVAVNIYNPNNFTVEAEYEINKSSSTGSNLAKGFTSILAGNVSTISVVKFVTTGVWVSVTFRNSAYITRTRSQYFSLPSSGGNTFEPGLAAP